MRYVDPFNITREQMYSTPYQHSPFLPVLLLSLATQKNSPDTTTYFRQEYDYIIVGAGSAGSVLAARLSEIPYASVLLLEAGGPPPLLTEIPGIARHFLLTDLDWNYLTVPQKHAAAGLINRQVVWPSGKALGGSTIYDAMLGFRGTRDDYDTWERMGARGWSWRHVLPYFQKLENNADGYISREGIDGIYGPVTMSRPPYNPALRKALIKAAKCLGYPFGDTSDGTEYGFSDFKATMRRGQRCSTAKAYLVPSENRKNLYILTRSLVTKILIRGKTAVGVQFDREGQTYEVRAKKEVIMSAGTVNTAQLLILSGIGPRKTLNHFQIPEVADLPVGLNFYDHCASYLNFVVNPSTPPFEEELQDPKNIKLYINKKVGPLASTQGISNVAFLHNNRCGNLTGAPDHELYFMEGSTYIPRTQFNMKPSVYQRIYGPYENSTIIFCVSSLLHPKSRGYVSIRSTDPYDLPVIEPNYFEHPNDVHDVASGLKTCLRIAETPPMRKLGVQPFETVVPGCKHFLNSEDAYLECVASSVVMSLSHQVGTAKMGDPRDPTTVVDPELRVKGMKGLRVVDASIMPRVPSGNTNLPVIMIAEKASDIIKRDVNCKC